MQGMPYKYVAATESKSFEGACSAITSARSRLQWASRFVTGEEIDFNEVLALGYFEKQAISVSGFLPASCRVVNPVVVP